ncbi:MAG TPA: hypothetical protein VGF67_04095 [Ktedonobacteraceae bacterium]|jgi:hypothetical protein
MQSISLPSIRSYIESLESVSNDLDAQSASMMCPHCGSLCPSIGKVNKNWYALCRCGTYIQQCNNAEDYCD